MCSPGYFRFLDRREAGQRLAEALAAYAGRGALVLALPRGGVPVAFEVARALGAQLDIMLVRKIGAPRNSELAIGALAEGQPPTLMLDEEAVRLFGISDAYVWAEKARALAEMERRRRTYRGDSSPVTVAGKIVILIDDGVATGNTMRAAVAAVKAAGPARVVIAVPVAPLGEVEALGALVDEVVCLSTPGNFQAVGLHYSDFSQTEDEEVIALLAEAGKPATPPA